MVIITLGKGNEFFIDSENNMGIRATVRGIPTSQINLGPATTKRMDRICELIQELRIHCTDYAHVPAE